ncbi:MAG: InlB B-repeat-containing protein [Acholeplasmatales bacterium]|jgi:M6 family metalloprotease-like protein|nr:InlB B-repeat-containing protein [Acholeplasmatales bacterium]
MNKMKKLGLLLVIIVSTIILVACNGFFGNTNYKITVNYENGEVTGLKTNYKKNELATLKAISDDGYTFVGWFENDILIELSDTLKVKANNQVIVALFVNTFGAYVHLDNNAYYVPTVDNILVLSQIVIPGYESSQLNGFYLDSQYSVTLEEITILSSYIHIYSYSNGSVIITFLNYDGSLLETVSFQKNEVVTTNLVPTKPSDNVYNYTFSGWNPQLTIATTNTSYTAQYSSSYIDYVITFVIDDLTSISQTYHYGQQISYNGQVSGELLGWSLSPFGQIIPLGTVSQNQSYYAVYQVLTLQSIEIISLPYITQYSDADLEIDVTGLIVRANYSDSVTSILALSELVINTSNINYGFGGSYQVIVSYTHNSITKSTSFYIEIILVTPVGGMFLNFPKQNYYIDERLSDYSSAGLEFQVTYSDSTIAVVAVDIDLSNVVWGVTGVYNVLISYTYHAVTIYASYDLTVYTLTSISLVAFPEQTTYSLEATSLNTLGLEVRAFYSNSTFQNVTSYTINASSILWGIAGFYNVTINYQEGSVNKAISYQVEVKKILVLDFDYQWQLVSGQVNIGGGIINNVGNLNWSWQSQAMSAISFSSTKGLQIGTTANPQLAYWLLNTTLPSNVVIHGYSLGLSVSAGGSAIAQIGFGNYLSEYHFESTSVINYVVEDLNVHSSSFNLNLKSLVNRAIYLHHIYISYSIVDEGPFVDAFPYSEINSIYGSNVSALLVSNIEAYYVNLVNNSGEFTINIEVNILDWNSVTLNQYLAELAGLGYLENSNGYYLVGEEFYLTLENLTYGVRWTLTEDRTPPYNIPYPHSGTGYQNIYEYQSNMSYTSMPSVGTYHSLVIPVQFPNDSFTTTELNNLNYVFNGTHAETGWESVSSYLRVSSYGNLNVTFDISPVFTASKNYASYQVSSGQYANYRDQDIIREALVGMDSTINFAQYDNNNDGTLDGVYFIYSRGYDYSTDPWWAWVYLPQATGLKNVTVDGKKLQYYQWASINFASDTGLSGVISGRNAETYIHETGHMLGMTDLYSNSNRGPLGGFDMQDYNCGDHGPFNKFFFGWIEPYIATHGTFTFNLPQYEIAGDTILIPYGSSWNGSIFGEYLLIMYYEAGEGLYAAHSNQGILPTVDGVVIYHVNSNVYSSGNSWWMNFLYDNESASSNNLIEILEADHNNSIRSSGVKSGDLLRSGTLNLGQYYTWDTNSSAINVIITINGSIGNGFANITLTWS